LCKIEYTGRPKRGQTAAGALIGVCVPAAGSATSGRDPFSSRTISPSRMYRIRLAIDAASGL